MDTTKMDEKIGIEIPIQIVPLTEEEIAERKQWAIDEENRKMQEEAKILAKQSALAKLAKLGLTQEEAEALIST